MMPCLQDGPVPGVAAVDYSADGCAHLLNWFVLCVFLLLWLAMAARAQSQSACTLAHRAASSAAPILMSNACTPNDILILSHGRPVERGNDSDATLLRAAHNGDPDAQVEVALHLSSPEYADASNAFRWLQRAALDGSPSAMNNLAVFYFQGRGVPADFAHGIHWMTRAAKTNFAPAELNLGMANYFGWGVSADTSQAFQWFLKSARHGFVPAQAAVGVAYETGDGVPKNYAQAIKWYRKAARHDNAAALNNLGGLYEFGEGVAQNLRNAADLYWRAIAAGSLEARGNMARLIVHGTDVPRDLVKACGLLLSAADRLPSAAKDSARVCELLTDEEQRNARNLAEHSGSAIP